jgi:pimeloyl-ACP methyl ester carboxylesterase
MHGVSEGGPMAMLFAVTYPERVTSLILNATSAALVPQGESPAAREHRHAATTRTRDVGQRRRA